MSSSTFGLIIWPTVSCVGLSDSLTLGRPDMIGFGTSNTVFSTFSYSTVSTLFLDTDNLNVHFGYLQAQTIADVARTLHKELGEGGRTKESLFTHLSPLVIFIFASSKKYKIL